MINKVNLWIEKAAKFFYRRQQPKKVVVLLRGLMMNILTTTALVAGIFMIWSKFQDRQYQATIEFEPSRWSVLFGKSDEACWDENLVQQCSASPFNDELWTSNLHRWDPEYFKLIEANLKAPFWMGLQISPAELKKAKNSGATRLMLGLVFGGYEVWVDGVRMQTGDYMENDLPIAIDISSERMQENRPLYIAIAVSRDGKMSTIDSQWIVPTMGFFTSHASDQQMRWLVFSGDTRFLIMFSIFLLFGLIFHFASTTDREKYEFRAASILSLILACSQFIMADSVFRILGATYYYPALSAILVAEALAIIGLGLTISRSRTEMISLINTLLPVAILITLFLVPDRLENGILTKWISSFLTPFSHFVAGSLCLLQFIYLQKDSELKAASPHRSTLLAVMTFFFFAIAMSFIAETQQAIAVETHWSRVMMIVPLLILTTTIAADVRRNFRLVETTPVSPFHKVTPLPNSVSGIIINLDLKNSERLFRAGAGQDVGGSIVSIIVAQIWARFAATGATILQSSGDDVLVLYPDAKLKEDPNLWVTALRGIHDELQLIARNLADNQIELSTLKSLEFRAAVSRGSVRPLWRIIGKTRIPFWIESGSSNVFVETVRLLELEKQWSTNQPDKKDNFGAESIFIMDESFKSDMPELDDLTVTPIAGVGKHDRSYRGIAVTIGSNSRPNLRMLNKAVV